MQIVKIYTGDLGPPITNGWLVSKSMYLHSLYLQTISNFLKHLEKRKDYRTIVQICQTALNIDQFDENINLKLLGALKDKNQKHPALAYYRHLTDLHYRSLGVSPPKSIINFYKELTKDGLARETDISTIQKELDSLSPSDGAFVCDYSMFKDIYQLQVRNCNRNGQTILLAIISIKSNNDAALEPLAFDKIARDLLIAIQSSLRKGDTVSRYSSTQFLVLLPIRMDVNVDGEKILNRVVRNSSYGHCSNASVQLGMQIIDIGNGAAGAI